MFQKQSLFKGDGILSLVKYIAVDIKRPARTIHRYDGVYPVYDKRGITYVNRSTASIGTITDRKFHSRMVIEGDLEEQYVHAFEKIISEFDGPDETSIDGCAEVDFMVNGKCMFTIDNRWSDSPVRRVVDLEKLAALYKHNDSNRRATQNGYIAGLSTVWYTTRHIKSGGSIAARILFPVIAVSQITQYLFRHLANE